MRFKNIIIIFFLGITVSNELTAKDNHGITSEIISENYFGLIKNNIPNNILIDDNEDEGIKIAVRNLQNDFKQVCGNLPKLVNTPNDKKVIIIGSVQSKYIKELIKAKKIDSNQLKNKNEKYIITVVDNPFDNIEEALVIAGSDKRGSIYGVYELSEQIGVSPWYDWADVPIEKKENLAIKKGYYTAEEPAVKYRGIFLNDEAPCLTGWVKNTYNTNYGDHRFYSRVFELILRLRGNFLWPAMWNWAFYQDDPLNSKTADEMGVIISTSHHEPMARNHQEWARNRNEYGKWNYISNQKTIDNFFIEGIERIKNTEDVITIGMRGDGDEAMCVDADVELLERVVKNQRKIIEKYTGKSANKTPQVWALYKEVLDYYDKGMRVPDDVIMLLCDDNWGNVRRLPNKEERKHPGGWGMYYHVDYVGAPRNSKWLNVTPIQNLWEQMQLTYEYGVDKLWVLNVGDLKPMEYPITLFLDMAWNPTKYTPSTLLNHTKEFCEQQFGKENAEEAKRLLNLYCKYAGRVTAEMLDMNTYNVNSGEWLQVSNEFIKLEAEALRQYISLKSEYKDAYKQLILFPIQAMANLYEMYFAQAMNHKLYNENNPKANDWADLVEKAFNRDKELSFDYNNVMSNGKWKNMMIQKHIGYTSWNDNFKEDIMPKTYRIDNAENINGGYCYYYENDVVSIEAEHYYEAHDANNASWTIIPYIGRTLSGVALMPYSSSIDNAHLNYKIEIPSDIKEVDVYVIVKSTLAFHNQDGHRYKIGFEGSENQIVNFNNNLNENPENIYSVFYPTVARRVIEKKIRLKLPTQNRDSQILKLQPLDPGIVFQKIVVDLGGYDKSYLYMNESPNRREINEK